MPFLRPILASAALLLALHPAAAADATAPVREVLAIAAENWSETPPAEIRDYFGEPQLATLYSKAFVADYRAAAKFPAFDEGTSPFDYDPITGGQDGCPLKDVVVGDPTTAGGTTTVVASFKSFTCFTDDFKDAPTTLTFTLVEEDGKAVIDDVRVETPGNEPDSLRSVLKIIATP